MTKNYSLLTMLLYLFLIGFITGACIPTTSPFPYSESFTASNGNFTFVNGTQTNKWFYGSASGNPPNAIYISNTTATANNYNIAAASVVHAHKDIVIPAGTTVCSVSFDWRAAGENAQDYLRIWLVPANYTPAAGVQITPAAGRIKVGTDYNGQGTWQSYLNTNVNISSFAGANMRLVFEWTNNASAGTQPPATVDNILINACFPPTGPTATAVTPTTATLNWTAPAQVPANGYEYYLSTVNNAPNNGTAATGTSNNVSVNVNQLSVNTSYFWWVRSACSATDKSAWVPGPGFTTKICSTATSVVSVNAITHNSASVTWPLNNGADSYKVRYRAVGTTTWNTVNQPVAFPPAAGNALNLTNLIPNTLYEVEVALVCNDTTGPYSHNEFTTRCDPSPPNVTVNNITTNSASIAWSPVAANLTYRLRWREVGTIPWNFVNLPVPPASTYVLPGLAPNKTYEVQVASQCPPETFSNSKVFTTERTCELPPSGLTMLQLLPTTAQITWDPFPGATYILRYRKVGIPSWTEIQTPNNTYTLTGLIELTKYELQVANICNGTPGSFTPPYFFTTPTVQYCGMASGSSAGEHIAKVTVKPAGRPLMENTSAASVYTDYTQTPKALIELVQGSTGNEITIEKKWTGTNYNEGIAAWIDFNRDGEFGIDERIMASGPNTVTPVKVTFDVPANAVVSMTDDKYVVMRVAMRRNDIPVACTNFAEGEVEDYKVRIFKNAVFNPLNQNDFLFYPNPVSTILNVKNISSKANYKLYHAGKLVSSGVLLNNKIDVSQLVSGVYVIDIQDQGNSIQGKFIKR
ncbi:fibronectin type III domain-containing protein [Chryseobacterium sp. L7]|uniref:Fibronectin type III domain-containing protein n=1 Tax=Chryseobacterium endalhagicum TaxID=2797638 RepID=A0ABS1Q9S4_9FLAO|nr:fibronectin type III domain-containing protein [Chryseobacterium endalhagicum]MBL1219348.1 fibronectin type III domain-containing protein [Chryseobacterium endalhagicum]